jgi:hypothetical protein
MKAWGNGGIAPPFLTSALDGDEWSSITLLSLYPRRKRLRYPLAAGWVREPVWTLWSREKSFDPSGNQALAVQPIAVLAEVSRLNKCKVIFAPMV